MKPTQAQIEAAAEVLEKLWTQPEPWPSFSELAKAALTAAAEAGKYPTGLEAISAFEKAQAQQQPRGGQKFLPVTAEARTMGNYQDGWNHAVEEVGAEIKAATIERCAQLVDKTQHTSREMIAAAIRAMKD